MDKVKEKLLREIEDIQEKIFAEVKRINTIPEYQRFLMEYPTGFYAEKAKEQLQLLASDLEEDESEKSKEFLPVLTPEPVKSVEKTAEKKPENKKSQIINMMEEALVVKSDEPKVEFLPDSVKETVMMKASEAGQAMKEGAPKPIEKVKPKPVEIRKVKATTKASLLNVRSKPSIKSIVVGKLKKGTQLQLLEETSNWYRVVFSGEKNGWISKRFAEEIP